MNPFGVSDFFNDNPKDGSMTIEPGGHVRFRYRVIIHPGATPDRIAERYKQEAETRAAAD